MAKTTTIRTRAQLGRYLQNQAEEMVRLVWGRSVLRELVEEAYALRERMPKDWNARAKTALRDITE